MVLTRRLLDGRQILFTRLFCHDDQMIRKRHQMRLSQQFLLTEGRLDHNYQHYTSYYQLEGHDHNPQRREASV